MRLCDKQQAKRVWEVRESALGATSHVPGEPFNWEGWEDAAVAPEKLGGYLRDLRKMFAAYGYKGSLYGHFGHGCVHTRINFDLQSKDGIAKFRKFIEEAADLVVSYGGSLSGEHGDGQSRGELLPKMFGPELIQAFRDFKSAWDPDWKMNPGKVIDPYKLDENLRLGANYSPWEPKTHFQFIADHGSLAEATLRCVGVGKCRRERGRRDVPQLPRHARRRALHPRPRPPALGNDARPRSRRWDHSRRLAQRRGKRLARSLPGLQGLQKRLPRRRRCRHLQSRIPLPLLRRPRPSRAAPTRSATSICGRGLASHMPGLANLATQLPFLRDLSKLLAGIPQERSIPAFAPETFKSWFHRTQRNMALKMALKGRGFQPRRDRLDGALAPEGSPEVLLWPDTFNNYFLPATAQAAVDVLEAAGFRVIVPNANLCCGRPLYDHGMLDRAQALLLQILDELSPQIEAGIPVVGLEPSCVAVFRDELVNLFPHDDRAKALSRQTFLLSEFLENHARNFVFPRLNRKALLHGHCHHKSLMKMTAEESVLRRLGIDFQSPAPGCCGMAGSFGFEREKYDISMAIGELELLPAVRRAPADWLIVADGFSCREQIAQGTPRHAMHLAEVLQMALTGETPTAEPYPESARVKQHDAEVSSSMTRANAGLAACAAGAALLWVFYRNR